MRQGFVCLWHFSILLNIDTAIDSKFHYVFCIHCTQVSPFVATRSLSFRWRHQTMTHGIPSLVGTWSLHKAFGVDCRNECWLICVVKLHMWSHHSRPRLEVVPMLFYQVQVDYTMVLLQCYWHAAGGGMLAFNQHEAAHMSSTKRTSSSWIAQLVGRFEQTSRLPTSKRQDTRIWQT